MTDSNSPGCADDCIVARRAFLKDVTMFAAALVAAGFAPRLASAAPRPVRALSRAANEVRYPIPAADGVEFDKENEVILVRTAGRVYAFALACPHQNTALRLEPSKQGFQCSRHHSKYKLDGAYISGRATRSMDRYAIRREGTVLVVNVALYYESDSEPTQWAGAVVTV
ncbi:MAG: Rieske (2Fe-2S) protein [Gemmatimonadota bacterium]